jgi:hypothetical protein
VNQRWQDLIYVPMLAAFFVKSNAERFKEKLENMLGKHAEIVIEGGFHKVRFLDLKDRMKMQEPKVSFLVASFSKRTQALKAKRKIESKLNLPVKEPASWLLYVWVKTEMYPNIPSVKSILKQGRSHQYFKTV